MLYAIKTIGTVNDSLVQPMIFEDLRNGKARFGWGYSKESNSIGIRDILLGNKWNFSVLTETQGHYWSKASFLLNIQAGDYLIYINLPEYGHCSIAQAVGVYSFDDGIYYAGFSAFQAEDNRDFRHFIPVRFVNTFLRNANYVHPHLYRRLVLQGRWWRIYADNEFDSLLKALKEGKSARKVTFEYTLKTFADELKPDLEQITNKILHNFPNKSLEEFVAHILKSTPNVIVESVAVKKGASDFGADVIFEYRNELINTIEKVAVQAKAYKGVMGFKRAIEDIERAFATDNTFTQGLIIGTALSITKEFETALDELREKSQKPIGIIVGSDFAKWALKSSNALFGG